MIKHRKSSRQCQVDHLDSRDNLDSVDGLTDKVFHEKSSGWDEAIFDAKKTIAEAEQKITDLRLGIKEFQRRKNAGEPWPGTSESTEKAAQRASST